MAKKSDDKQKIKLLAAVGMLAAAGGIYFYMNRNTVDRPTGTVQQVFGGNQPAAESAPAASMSSTEEGAEPEFDGLAENPAAGSHMMNPEFEPPDSPEPEEPPPAGEPPPGR